MVQSDTKLNEDQLKEAFTFLCIVVASVFILKIMSMSMNKESDKNKSGIVYLISISGRVQISDFKGAPYIENGYYTWYDKKRNKHWTKAPLMFVEIARGGKK